MLVMIGVHSREPIVELLRSRVFFDWFDAAGVEEIPAVFAGEIVDRFVARAAAEDCRRPGVLVVADRVRRQRSHVDLRSARTAIDRFNAAGIRKTWVFQAFDDDHEVLILQEIPDEESARRWINQPDAAAQWMTGAGSVPIRRCSSGGSST